MNETASVVTERNAEVVCPFCGCLYDHDELVALYARAEAGTVSKDEALAAMAEFHDRVLAEPENADGPDEQ